MGRFKIHAFETIDSTQIEAKKPIYKPGDVIIAETQTASYGRRGRSWIAPPGNLYTTMVEEWHGVEQLSWLGYAVGLALFDVVQPLLIRNTKLRLKWPNDLLINEQKMTGILLEVENNHLLIGIGMNISVTPETDQPVTCLNDHTKEIHQPIDILKSFLKRYQFWYKHAIENGFTSMRSIWLSRAAYIGENITARLADGTVLTGIFDDIDQQGALVLQSENGQYNVTAADIYLTKKKDDQKSLTG